MLTSGGLVDPLLGSGVRDDAAHRVQFMCRHRIATFLRLQKPLLVEPESLCSRQASDVAVNLISTRLCRQRLLGVAAALVDLPCATVVQKSSAEARRALPLVRLQATLLSRLTRIRRRPRVNLITTCFDLVVRALELEHSVLLKSVDLGLAVLQAIHGVVVCPGPELLANL